MSEQAQVGGYGSGIQSASFALPNAGLFPLLRVAVLVLSAGAAALGQTKTNTNLVPRVYRDEVLPHWFAGANGETNQFWYRVQLPGDRSEFILVDAPAGHRALAFDAEHLAKALSDKLGRTVEAGRLPVTSLEFAPDEKSVALHGAGGDWNLDLEAYTLTPRTNAASGAGGLPNLGAPQPSKDAGEETDIHFINRLDREVELFWIDPNGTRTSYGTIEAGASKDQHTYAGHAWLVTPLNRTNVLAVFEATATPANAVIGEPQADAGGRRRERGRRGGSARPAGRGDRSPDGKWEAFVRDQNLFLRDAASRDEFPLTTDGRTNSTYARDEEINRAIEMQYDQRDPATPVPEVYWSPDSKHLVAMRLQPGTQRRVYLVESSPEDQLQPKLVSYPYLKPGDQVPIRKPHLFDVVAKMEIPVDDALFSNPWSVGELRWAPDSSRFTFLFNQRGHQVLRIVAVDAQSGAATAIVDERSKTFIDYSGKFFDDYLDDTGEILWMSERDGWNHLYLYDAKTGAVKNQITKGDWVVRGVDDVDPVKRQIWFRAGGIRPGQDPYFVQYCRVNFDGTGLTMLTEGDGTHTAQFSPDHRYLVDTWSRVDLPPVTELRRGDDGQMLCKLEEADAAELYATGWKPPEPFTSKARDGVTDIYGVIFRPKNFDPAKKYPVIENIYAGPQDSFTPKNFRTTYQHQKLADHGFVVVQMDGMGTSNRSKRFHDYCWKNLADAGFPDRILWIRAAAAHNSFMDLTRVGIYGTSAGGQDALRGMLDHGDFYKVCVSDSGCHDNRMDKIWWNEQWMGWPVDESYEKSSNVVDAHKLQGKLLLMVGEMDKNVDPSSTMQVVNALIKADKDFELLDMPGAGHGVARTAYGARRLEEFFVRNLLGGEPSGTSAATPP